MRIINDALPSWTVRRFAGPALEKLRPALEHLGAPALESAYPASRIEQLRAVKACTELGEVDEIDAQISW